MPPQAKFACKPVLAGSVATEAGVSGVCAHYERGEGRVGMEGINRAASSRRHPLMSISRGPTFCACGGLAVTSCPCDQLSTASLVHARHDHVRWGT